MLENLNIDDVKRMSVDKLNVLCDEIRRKITDTVLVTGGHLASNLGIVETTVAMHHVFDFPRDKVVFDVGHQCYPHKLLSGRYHLFPTLRTRGGISGFPKRSESEYDSFDTGHAGTALSAALGIAKSRDLSGQDYFVIAVVGDGSFNNGLVYEALNSLSVLHTKVLIVLNDNGMSISPTVGGMHNILSEIKEGDDVRNSIYDVALLERFGLRYVGVKDGNDVEEMIDAFESVKPILKHQSVLLHIVTKKGRGYEFCEDHPTATHGISPKGSAEQKEYSQVLGETLGKIAEKDNRIVVVTAAMTGSLGLDDFFRQYPDRSFDVGICEEHASVLCASMATQGLKPYYAIYSTFLQRAYDEIIHDICCQNLPVTLCVDRAGVSGYDGETHQGVFDLSYLLPIPNLTVAVPKDREELESMLYFSASYHKPLAIRYPRAGTESFGGHKPIVDTKWEYLNREGGQVTIFACGERCLSIAARIKERFPSKKIDIVNARFVKPLDRELLSKVSSPVVVTIEDNVLIGGFGGMIEDFYAESGKIVKKFGYRDEFIPQGGIGELMRDYGLNEEEIASFIGDRA